MSIWLSVILCALLGYLLGCINPAYLIARARGFDIRSRGSGNAGASNAVITMGKAAGVFSAIIDIFKAWLAVCLATRYFTALSVGGIPVAGEIAGVACMLGHMFPFYGFPRRQRLCLHGRHDPIHGLEGFFAPVLRRASAGFYHRLHLRSAAVAFRRFPHYPRTDYRQLGGGSDSLPCNSRRVVPAHRQYSAYC